MQPRTALDKKVDNRIRMLTYQADEFLDALRAILRMLNQGEIEEAKQALRESIRQVEK